MKRLTPTQRAYKQQIQRVQRNIRELKKQGFDTSKLEQEFKKALTSRPTSKSVEKLKREYTSHRIKTKAGLVQTQKGYVSRETYEQQREERWEKQREAYKQKQERKQIKQTQKRLERERKAEQTAKQFLTPPAPKNPEYNPPKETELILDRITGMIGDATIIGGNQQVRTTGTAMLQSELARQIKKYGRKAVAEAMQNLPSSYVEDMETLIKYEQSAQQNSFTIRKLAEAIKSEILSPTERQEIANYTDSEEEYG